jgi:hypothetical protein
MSAELIALAQSAATTLVGAAATDAWSTVRNGFVKIFGRDERAVVRADRQLDDTADQVRLAAAADREAVNGRLAVAWETRLADALDTEPEIATALRQWQEAVESVVPPSVTQQIYIARDKATQYIAQGSNATINVHRSSPR